jgi:hypothetical protein
LTRGIVNKIMHTPISTLKTAAREPESTTVIDLVRRLFNLHDEEHHEVKDAATPTPAAGPKAKSKTGADD